MNDLIYTILNYVASAASVAGFVVVAKFLIKKFGDLGQIKLHLGFICKKLQESQDRSEKLEKELKALQMQLKGFREHGKKSIKKD